VWGDWRVWVMVKGGENVYFGDEMCKYVGYEVE
jgi:hypothetical protein